MSAPEFLPAKVDRLPLYANLGTLATFLIANATVFLKFRDAVWSVGSLGFWLWIAVNVAFLAASYRVFYIPRRASLSVHDEGLVVLGSRRAPGIAVRWEAIALRGRRAYLYHTAWGPPLSISLTEEQRERIAERMRVEPPQHVAAGRAARGTRLRFATLY